MAMCVMPVDLVAPCQCFSPGGNQTTSPGRISSTGPFSRCAQPQPAVTMRDCPSGCVCDAVQMHVSVEELRAVEFHLVRHPDVAYVSAGTRGPDGLHHGFLRADALEHGICADAVRQIFHPRNAFIAALRDDVGCSELAR